MKETFAIKLIGFPHFVAHFAPISGLKSEMAKIAASLLKEIWKMLEYRTFGCVLSETRIESFIEH